MLGPFKIPRACRLVITATRLSVLVIVGYDFSFVGCGKHVRVSLKAHGHFFFRYRHWKFFKLDNKAQ